MVFGICGMDVIKTKTMQLKRIMLSVVCFFWDFSFFFCNRKNNILFLLFQYDLAPITSMISFPTTLPLTLQAYWPLYSFSNIPSMIRPLGLYPCLHLELLPLDAFILKICSLPSCWVSAQKPPYWRQFPRPSCIK